MPLLYTQDFVVSKLQGGADLMTPGLTRGPPFPSKARKGAVVAVASIQKPSVPQWVGICEIDIATLQQVQGAKGHAVRAQHWAGDDLWAWSPSGKPGLSAPENIEGWDVDDRSAAIVAGVQSLDVEDDEDEDDGRPGGIPLNSANEETTVCEPQNHHVEGEDMEPYEKIDVPEKELSTKGEFFLVVFREFRQFFLGWFHRTIGFIQFVIRKPVLWEYPLFLVKCSL